MMPSLEEVIQSSRRDLNAQLPERLAEINKLWNARAIPDLYRAAHKLFGSSAMLGLDEVSRAAQVLEAALGSILRDGGAVTAEQENVIADQITVLTDITQKPTASPSQGEGL